MQLKNSSKQIPPLMNGDRKHICCMNRKYYIIYVVVFVLLQWPWACIVGKSFLELLVLLLSNILGAFFGCIILYEAIPEIWLYLFDNAQWLHNHSNGIGSPGFSYDAIIWTKDIRP
jgi:hypothetical protein